MQAVKFTFVQTDCQGAASQADWNAELESCPGHSNQSLAKYPLMAANNPLFVLDKMNRRRFQHPGRARQSPPRTNVFDAVAAGTSGAESALNDSAKAARPTHRRARRGASAGLLAAQPRRISFATSRALLLLPPSLVRSGALRSDISSPAPARGRLAAAPAGAEMGRP